MANHNASIISSLNTTSNSSDTSDIFSVEEYLAVLGVLGFLQMLLTVAFFLGIFVIVIKNFQKGRKHSHALRVCMYMIKRNCNVNPIVHVIGILLCGCVQVSSLVACTLDRSYYICVSAVVFSSLSLGIPFLVWLMGMIMHYLWFRGFFSGRTERIIRCFTRFSSFSIRITFTLLTICVKQREFLGHAWIEEYKAICEKHSTVKIRLTRCLLTGPPGVGKSSLKHLLMYDNSANISTSTPVLEEPGIVEQKLYQHNSGSSWIVVDKNMRQKLIRHKAREMLNAFHHRSRGWCCAYIKLFRMSSTHTVTNIRADNRVRISSCCYCNKSEIGDVLTQALKTLHEEIADQTIDRKMLNEKTTMHFIHFLDSGGQPVFHDILPLFIGTPCLYIYVFNSINGLDVPLLINYRYENGTEIVQTDLETETARDLMLRMLSSIHTMEQKVSVDFKHLLYQSRPEDTPKSSVIPVATFQDKLIEGIGELKSEEDLHHQWESMHGSQAMKPYKSLLRSELFLINNKMYCSGSTMTEDQVPTLSTLRDSITSSKAIFDIKIPIPWLLVDLITNKAGLKFIDYSTLQKFCIQEHLVSSKKEFSTLIAFMHTLGFFAYFNIPESTEANIICTDSSFLYQQVSKLLVVQFLPSPLFDSTKELKARGVLHNNYFDLFDELGIANNDIMDRQWFLQLLVHVGIAAKTQNNCHFVPLTLPPKPVSPSPLSGYSQYSVSPICFTVELKQDESFGPDFVHILPRGIYCQLCTYVIQEAGWLPVPGRSCRTRIVYLMDTTASVYLTETPTHIEASIHMHQGSAGVCKRTLSDVHSVCSKIKTLVLRGIEAAYKTLFSQSDVSIAVGFTCHCRGASRDHHLRLVNGDNCESARCCNGVITPLGVQEIIWLTKATMSNSIGIDIKNVGDERICIVQNVSEVPLNMEERLSSVKVSSDEDMKPSDIGLLGILEMLPLWTEYAIPLGLSINRVKYYQELPQENMRGLLALQYWRDGLCGSSYPGTWKFLLTVIEDKLGHNVAENLQTKITANRAWRLSSQTGNLQITLADVHGNRGIPNADTPVHH